MQSTGLINEPGANVEYLAVKEGLVEAIVTTSSPLEVETYIRSYPGWKLTLNGKKVTKSLDLDNIYLSFSVPAGKNLVKLKYTPTDLYTGVYVTIAFRAALLVFMVLFRKKIYAGLETTKREIKF